MSPSRIASAALGLALLLVTGLVQASRVRFVSEASEPFNRRVVAELSAVGFDVDETTDMSAPLPEGSVAVVHAKNEPAEVEVWLIEGGDHVVLSTVIARDLESSDDADSTKIAERLRAFLQPLAEKGADPAPPSTPAPAAAETPPLPAPLPPVERERPTPHARPTPPPKNVVLDLGGAISSQPGGAALSLAFGARYTFAHPLGARAFVAFPLRGSTLEESGASADVDARFAGLSAELELMPQRSDLRLAFGGGGGIAWLHAQGQAAAPREGHSVDTLAGLAFADAMLGYRFAGDFSLLAGALGGVALPKTDIEFSGSRVGTYGRPLLLGALALGYDL
jgi:hypothetical protein